MRFSDGCSDVCASELVAARMEKAGAEAERPEARQLAQLVAAHPAAEGVRLGSADIRALIAPANDALPAVASDASDVSIVDDGDRRTIAMVERDSTSIAGQRSEEHTSELQSLMRISYAVFCLKKKQQNNAQLIQKYHCKANITHHIPDSPHY